MEGGREEGREGGRKAGRKAGGARTAWETGCETVCGTSMVCSRTAVSRLPPSTLATQAGCASWRGACAEFRPPDLFTTRPSCVDQYSLGRRATLACDGRCASDRDDADDKQLTHNADNTYR